MDLLEELYPTLNIVQKKDKTVKRNEFGRLETVDVDNFILSKNNIRIFNIQLMENFIVIQDVSNKTEKSISSYLSKAIIFGTLLKDRREVAKIEIGGDASMIIFGVKDEDFLNKAIFNNEQEFFKKTLSISLTYLNLLAYGKSWYNRLGFGEQSEEWDLFIKTPLISFLEKIKFPVTNIRVDMISIYKNATISETFQDIIQNLKSMSTRENGINNVLRVNTSYVLFIFRLTEYIFSYPDECDEEFHYYYVPKISSDVSYKL